MTSLRRGAAWFAHIQPMDMKQQTAALKKHHKIVAKTAHSRAITRRNNAARLILNRVLGKTMSYKELAKLIGVEHKKVNHFMAEGFNHIGGEDDEKIRLWAEKQ